MPNFAVIDGESVLNTIVADSKEVAEEVTGKTCIEFTDQSAEPGGTYSGGVFIKRKPYPSWVLDDQNNWQAPVAYPTVDENDPKFYAWDEASAGWVEVSPEA
jgi:hypothetical protein